MFNIFNLNLRKFQIRCGKPYTIYVFYITLFANKLVLGKEEKKQEIEKIRFCDFILPVRCYNKS